MILAESISSPAYTEAFYSEQQQGSIDSAAVIVPIVISAFRPRSVVDIGCGVGGWLREFARHGVEDILGIDGDYVPKDALKIAPERFVSADLQTFDGPGRLFDLACSLEVAEHLPASCAERFVAALVGSAPVVLFSAAIPRQGGTDHVNERWQSYWARLFEAHGYICLDLIRPSIFDDDRVELWYRQNALVFCKPEHCPTRIAAISSSYELDRIHPRLLESLLESKCDRPERAKDAAISILENLNYIRRALKRRVRGG